MAKLDKEQFAIVSINYYRGNPFIRTSMQFNITFDDGDKQLITYKSDLAETEQFKSFVDATPSLYPLRFDSRLVNRQIAQINRTPINVTLNSSGYLNLRYYDGSKTAWYDNLNFPEVEKTYVVEIKFLQFTNASHRHIQVLVSLSNNRLCLNTYEVFAYCLHTNMDLSKVVIVDETFRVGYPQLFTVI